MMREMFDTFSLYQANWKIVSLHGVISGNVLLHEAPVKEAFFIYTLPRQVEALADVYGAYWWYVLHTTVCLTLCSVFVCLFV